MNFFEEATLRLKQQLGATQDKEVALALGLSPQSWVGRKKRDNFPEVELRALAQQRPDLQIDVDYVLNGGGMHPMTGRRRNAREQALIDAAVTAGAAVLDERQIAQAVAGKRRSAKEDALLVAGVQTAPVSSSVQTDEARLLAAFRAADSAGRAAILLAARGIAALSN